MSDSSPSNATNIKLSTPIDLSSSSNAQSRNNLIIISLPKSLENTEKPTSLRGEITEKKGDGTIIIHTEKGDVIAKSDKQLNLSSGDKVELRLPTGNPPPTANIRPINFDKQQTNNTAHRQIEQISQTASTAKIPQQITIKELLEQATPITLKPLPLQQIAKIVVPYLESIKSQLTQAIIEPADNLSHSANTFSLPPVFAPNTPQSDIPILLDPKLIKLTINLLPKTVSELSGQDDILISTAQGLLSFLKKQSTEDLLKAKLTPLPPLPQEIPARIIAAKLITSPLSIPITADKTAQTPPVFSQLNSSTAPQSFASSFEITAIYPPLTTISDPLAQTQPINQQQNLITPPSEKLSSPEDALLRISLSPLLPTINQDSQQHLQPLSLSSPSLNFIPPAPASPSPQPNKIDTLNALVIGYTPEQNFPILQILKFENARGSVSDKFYVLELPIPIPIKDIPLGTQIELKISTSSTSQSIGLNPSSPSFIDIPPLSMPHFFNSSAWDSLNELSASLLQISSAVGQSFNSNLIPQATSPQQLGPTALFFLAAIRSGDITNWLGDKTVDLLKKAGKGDLLSRLSGEFSALSRLSLEPQSQEWRITNIPLNYNNEIQKIVVHYKKDEREQPQDEKKISGGTRFLMNLNLSKIGPLQLDGLFQPDKKRLDLMLRTNLPFNLHMQNQMRVLYKGSLDEVSYTGELTFQNKPEQWVHITPNKRSAFSQKI